jgi:DNA-binding NarL/FixJ family response regulator
MTQVVASAPHSTASKLPIVVSLRATDPVTLAGLNVLLRSRPELRVSDHDEAQAADVHVLAAHRLDSRTVTLLRKTAAADSGPGVLLLDEINEAQLLLALECSVQAVLPRSAANAEQLARTVVAVATGDGLLPPALVGGLLKHLRHLRQQVLDDSGFNAAGLTPREVELIRLMADGLDTKEIAKQLHCSERTVKGTLHHVTRRLRLRNRSHIVAHAMRYGVI